MLRILQQFNLQIPVVNMQAIEGLVDPDTRQLNRRLFKGSTSPLWPTAAQIYIATTAATKLL